MTPFDTKRKDRSLMRMRLPIYMTALVATLLALGALAFGYYLGAIGWTPPRASLMGSVAQTSFTRPAQIFEALDVPGASCGAADERCLEVFYNNSIGNPALIAEVTEIPFSTWTIVEEPTDDDGRRIQMQAQSNKLVVRIDETHYPLPDDYNPFAAMLGERAEAITTRTHVDVYRLD